MSDSKPSFREELIRENSRFLGNFLDQHGFIALCLAFIFALALLDKLSSIRITSTPIATEFGTAVDTNSWFLVNGQGYFVAVPTNVWPVKPGTEGIDMGISSATLPRNIYVPGFRIMPVQGSSNILTIQSLKNRGHMITITDF